MPVSPSDEVEDDPCDAAPEEYDAALAADRGPDRGLRPAAPGFFWLGGQGGCGLRTAPAMAAVAEALLTGGACPEGLAEPGVMADVIRPERLRSSQGAAT